MGIARCVGFVLLFCSSTLTLTGCGAESDPGDAGPDGAIDATASDAPGADTAGDAGMDAGATDVGAMDAAGMDAAGMDATATDASVDAPGVCYPPATTGLPETPPPAASEPALYDSVAVANTTLTRVTDHDGHSTQFVGANHNYPVQGVSWNRDSTYYRIGYRLYDAITHQELAFTQGSEDDAYDGVGGVGGAGFFWSHVDPNVFYAVRNGGVKKLIISADGSSRTEETIISDGHGSLEIANTKGMLSYDGRYVVAAANDDTLVLFDLFEERKVWEKPWPGNSGGMATVDATASYIVTDEDGSYYTYDIDLSASSTSLTNREVIPTGSGLGGGAIGHIGHANVGVDTNGDPVLVGMTHNEHTISMYNLHTKEQTVLLDDNFGGGHVTTGNYLRPGYALVSAEGWDTDTAKVFAIRLDPNANGNATTEVFCDAYSSQFTGSDYEQQKHVTTNPYGNLAMFGTNFGSGRRDTYIATCDD